ncbi:multidrug resistance protein-like protein 2 [Lophiostoma macrostomum CBS 122681]|uniref:Multidrug resistance protein-like protein 2 n=1 Tax=Lophiostoma macrostomum CBS 122681 TaxID=1314788 RepID=A0A6A6THS7_9PLEO|nr:multidrug resistance protein-like protein 2 [Lophiostoma macrostomum CBS 122681]
MTSASEPSTADEQDKPVDHLHSADEQDDFLGRVGWKALFGFTTRKHLPILIAGFISAVIAALSEPALAVLYGLLFRQLSDFGAGKISGSLLLHNASKYCAYMTALVGLNWFACSFFFTFYLAFGELQARSARERVFDALLQKDLDWYDTRKSGIAAMLPTIQMQIRDLQQSTSAPFGEGSQAAVLTIGSMGVALYFCWDLTLVSISTIPLIFLAIALLSRQLSRHEFAQSDALQSALKTVTSAISSIETVKCFNGERSELARYGFAIARAGGLYKRLANYGGHLVATGKRNPGQIVTTFYSALMAVQGISSFMPQFIILQKGKIAGARLRAIIDRISSLDNAVERGGGERPERCSGDIEFKKVSFAYPTRPGQPALNQASIFFPAGETTFVVGRSGSGKSTLGQLLVRFYKPASGDITLDGTSVENLSSHWLRENITLVEQHSVLFNDTIRRNIALANTGKDVPEKQLEDVVDFALLRQMVKDLPNGLDTLTGAQGNALSGGQRQRVALARARLRDTPVLILDESTSALDYITRSAILEAMRAWRKGKTTIVITHDITQILPSDFMYILDRAQVVQEGYRQTLEADPHSAFHTFLDSVPDDHRGSIDSFEEYTDEIWDLYEASWTAPPPPRTMREVLFSDTFMSPIFSPNNRSSLYRSSLVMERRPSNPMLEWGSDGSEQDQEDAMPAKMPPQCSAVGEAKGDQYPMRRISQARPRPLSSCGSPIYSRPTSLVLDVPIRLDVRDTPSTKGRISIRRAITRRRRQEEVQELPTTGVKSLSITRILMTFWPRLDWQSKLYLIAAIICAFVHAAATPMFGFVFAKLLGTFYAVKDQALLARTYALSILGIAIIDGLATYGFHFLFDVAAQTWANSLKAEALRRILMQPREFFDREENSLSRLAECLDHFGEEARNLPGRFIGIIIVIVVMVLIAVVWSLATCWKLALVAMGTVPVLYGIMKAYNMISSRWERLTNEADENVGQVLHETFVNIRTVRCLVLEDVFRKKFGDKTADALRTGLKRAIYTGSVYGLNYSSVFFVSALAFWFGAYILSRNEFTLPNILQTFALLLLTSNNATFIVNYIPQINISKDAAARLIRLATLPQDSHELKGTTQLDSAGAIAFRDAVFSYPTRKDHQVLQGVNITIPRGSCTAIVGSSGSGKSTIAALLLKLYQMEANAGNPKNPVLTVSGHDIRTLHTSTLRSRMAIVSQTPVMFPGTVAENIAYGLSPSSSRASPENIRAAATAAGVDDFINSLPSGYQTVIGAGGSGLSGGQAQRIAIARALVRDPDILILDEATSALDVESANVVRDTVQSLVAEMRKDGGTGPLDSKGVGHDAGQRRMTVIIITHAREMMAIAEHVIMLDKGRVVEEGSFGELRKKRGPFARLLRGVMDE